MLNGKKILFITPAYFDYPEIIRSGLEEQGAEVDLIYCSPTDAINKIISVLSDLLLKKYEKRYFRIQKKRIKKSYDFILIIRADLIPEDFIKFLRVRNPVSFFIQYLWDDIGMFPSITDSFNYFDRILSYNIHDSKEFGLKFRPFFFIPDDVGMKEKRKQYDLFFIGIFHTDRVEVIEKVKRLNPGVNFYLHFYINLLTFLKAGIPFKYLKLFRLRKMNYKEMIGIVKRSSAVLDIPKPTQRGLSTRVIEALGAGVKVITTNVNVKEYEFYNCNNFLIIDREKPLIEKEWMPLPYKVYDEGLVNRYHISNWIGDVFNSDININMVQY